MSANPIYLPQQLSAVTCPDKKCGIQFAIPARLEEELRKTHESFYCPHGHSMCFRGKSDEEKLREELDKTKWRLQNANDAVGRARDDRDKAIEKIHKTQKRLVRGRCPASRRCKVRFENLQEHLKTHHHRYPWRSK